MAGRTDAAVNRLAVTEGGAARKQETEAGWEPSRNRRSRQARPPASNTPPVVRREGTALVVRAPVHVAEAFVERTRSQATVKFSFTATSAKRPSDWDSLSLLSLATAAESAFRKLVARVAKEVKGDPKAAFDEGVEALTRAGTLRVGCSRQVHVQARPGDRQRAPGGPQFEAAGLCIYTLTVQFPAALRAAVESSLMISQPGAVLPVELPSSMGGGVIPAQLHDGLADAKGAYYLATLVAAPGSEPPDPREVVEALCARDVVPNLGDFFVCWAGRPVPSDAGLRIQSAYVAPGLYAQARTAGRSLPQGLEQRDGEPIRADVVAPGCRLPSYLPLPEAGSRSTVALLRGGLSWLYRGPSSPGGLCIDMSAKPGGSLVRLHIVRVNNTVPPQPQPAVPRGPANTQPPAGAPSPAPGPATAAKLDGAKRAAPHSTPRTITTPRPPWVTALVGPDPAPPLATTSHPPGPPVGPPPGSAHASLQQASGAQAASEAAGMDVDTPAALAVAAQDPTHLPVTAPQGPAALPSTGPLLALPAPPTAGTSASPPRPRPAPKRARDERAPQAGTMPTSPSVAAGGTSMSVDGAHPQPGSSETAYDSDNV